MARADIGVYGLGVMGRALALNLAEQGFDVAVTNREHSWIADVVTEAGPLAGRLHPQTGLADFVAGLKTPRVVLFMIPSGAPMESMIEAITPLLEAGDTIIDGGNANFHDTRRRAAALALQDLQYVGMGVSGGEAGARHGPSLMVGGTAQAWRRLEPMLTAIAAKYQGVPCVAHLGPDGAGHFVKTVHNGIEYADMQMIAEAYGVMRFGLGMSAAEIAGQFEAWDKGPLRSYLTEITGALLRYEAAGEPFVDLIRDVAGQKGTGRWTVIEALHLGQSASLIEAAVGARSWSSQAQLRARLAVHYGAERGAVSVSVEQIGDALMAGRLLAYVQGFHLLGQAAQDYGWPLDFARIAQIWRAGCIIRAAVLDEIATAFEQSRGDGQLLDAPAIVAQLQAALPGLRAVAGAALGAGHPAPALVSAVSFFDTLRIERGTANILQAQRDFFGRHGFERLDQTGQHHGPWWD